MLNGGREVTSPSNQRWNGYSFRLREQKQRQFARDRKLKHLSGNEGGGEETNSSQINGEKWINNYQSSIYISHFLFDATGRNVPKRPDDWHFFLVLQVKDAVMQWYEECAHSRLQKRTMRMIEKRWRKTKQNIMVLLYGSSKHSLQVPSHWLHAGQLYNAVNLSALCFIWVFPCHCVGGSIQTGALFHHQRAHCYCEDFLNLFLTCLLYYLAS